MHASHNRVLAAQEAARKPSIIRPREALPRRLQACMQELLSVNERYHELLVATDTQRLELEAAQKELAQLRPALASAEAKAKAQEEALSKAVATAEDLRAAHDLKSARCNAAEAERDDLHKVVKAYAERLLEAEQKLSETEQRNVEAEAWIATTWQTGFDEGVQQQRNEVRGKLRRAQQQAEARAADAFERGRQHSSAEAGGRLLREQAERRLLLHRAEEARLQQRSLAKALEDERQAREVAEGRSVKLSERLRGVRHEKQSLDGDLSAARAAHAADLEHFGQMESALGLACAEYSSLAAKHARAVSPPPTRTAAADREGEYGSSPPSAMRSHPPRPAAIAAE